jgi:hypothetical protein
MDGPEFFLTSPARVLEAIEAFERRGVLVESE